MSLSGVTNVLRNEERSKSLTIGIVLPFVEEFCPVFLLHPKALTAQRAVQERYLPCSVQWFFERSELVSWEQLHTGLNVRRLLSASEVSAERVAKVMLGVPKGADLRLVLADKAYHHGQAQGDLESVPVYATVKEVEGAKLHGGATGTLLEINYMALYANNGAYKLGITGRETGEHEGDWEHITVRCTTSGKLVAVYYGAHRHGDGKWVAAADVPRERQSGRIVSYVAINGHGAYPAPATWRRIFGIANDVTAARGPVWAPRKCIVVTRPREGVHMPGNVPSDPVGQQELAVVQDRGTRAYAPLDGGVAAGALVDLHGTADVSAISVRAVPEFTPWLEWRLKWGTQLAPQLQQWFWRAEHPAGTTAAKRVCLPCVRN